MPRFVRHFSRLKSYKQRLLARTYRYINPLYQRVFAAEINCHSLDSWQISKRVPGLASLDENYNYYALHASFGDKWCILSLMAHHLRYYKATRVLASRKDKDIIDIFLGRAVREERFIFVDDASLVSLTALIRPVSLASVQVVDFACAPDCGLSVTPYLLATGIPPKTIRHLHIVYYPYFSELIHLHGVTYGSLIRTLLYLPRSAQTEKPKFYQPDDHRLVEELLRGSPLNPEVTSSARVVLLNVVNISHSSLSLEQLAVVLTILESRGFDVLVNAAQAPNLADYENLVAARSRSRLVAVPGKLLALLSSHVDAVIGVLGGAMNIAVQFGSSHVLSLQTSSLWAGCSEDELFGGHARDPWGWIDKDWPCLADDRVVDNQYIGDPALISDADLGEIVSIFLDKIS